MKALKWPHMFLFLFITHFSFCSVRSIMWKCDQKRRWCVLAAATVFLFAKTVTFVFYMIWEMQMYLNTSLYFCRWNVKTPSMADIQKFRLLPSNWPLDQSAAWKNNSFYLLTRMWIGHWTEGTGVFGTKQVRCLQCSGIDHHSAGNTTTDYKSTFNFCTVLLTSFHLSSSYYSPVKMWGVIFSLLITSWC